MNTAACYKPAAHWPVAVALGAALSIELAALALASLHRPEKIPTVFGVVAPPPIEAKFIVSLPELVTPESVPPPLPPPPEAPLEFISVEPHPSRESHVRLHRLPHGTSPALPRPRTSPRPAPA